MAKNEWFAEVRWCEDDIKCRLEELAIPCTEELVDRIRSDMEHHCFTDQLIECGWDVMDVFISDAVRERENH